MKDMTMGGYIPGHSIIHRSDPRTKIVLTMVFMALAFLLESVHGLFILLAVNLLVAKKAGKPIKFTLKGLRPIIFMALFAVVANIFYVAGTPVADHGILSHFSLEGITLATKLLLRLVLLASSATLLTFTTSPLALTDGLEMLMRPLARLKVPVKEMSLMISMAMRFIPSLLQEAKRIANAQSSRAPELANARGLGKLKGFMPLLVPLFVTSFRKSDELATAMEARCFSVSAVRTRMKRMEFSRADLVSSCVMIFVATALIMMEHAGY